MPRQLLRDGAIVVDDWRYADEATPAVAGADSAAFIVKFERWRAEREAWLARSVRLGVVLAPADKVEDLEQDLPRLGLVAADFGGPSEGRGYTQARLLRERYGFGGELRAIGFVRRDQVFFMARCGFNAFELPDGEWAAAQTALRTFSAEYQPSNDRGLSVKPRYRPPGTTASV